MILQYSVGEDIIKSGVNSTCSYIIQIKPNQTTKDDDCVVVVVCKSCENGYLSIHPPSGGGGRAGGAYALAQRDEARCASTIMSCMYSTINIACRSDIGSLPQRRPSATQHTTPSSDVLKKTSLPPIWWCTGNSLGKYHTQYILHCHCHHTLYLRLLSFSSLILIILEIRSYRTHWLRIRPRQY